MTEKLKQTIKEEIMKLPKEAQEAINSLDWTKVAEEIGKKHLLTESEVNDLQVEILLVLVGLESGYSYPLKIENEVGTSREEAEKIAEEANQKIFTPIYNILEENIKKNLPNKKSTPEQNLNFILSGGDYSVFMEERKAITATPTIGAQNPPENEKGQQTEKVIL